MVTIYITTSGAEAPEGGNMRNDEYSVSLSAVAGEQGLTILHAAKDFDSVRVRTADVNRPALQLAGFYDYFDPKRLQLIGRVENTFLESLDAEQRREALERFMRFDICAIIRTGMQSVQVIAWFTVLGLTDYGFTGWVYSNLAVNAVFVLLAIGFSKSFFRPLHFNAILVRIKTVYELCSASTKLFIIKLSIFSLSDVYPFLFSSFGSMTMNTVFQSASKSSGLIVTIVGNASSQFLPHLTDSFVRNDFDRIKRIYYDSCRVIFSFVSAATVLSVFYSDYLFYLWLGRAMPENWLYTSKIFSWFVIILAFSSTASIQYHILFALNKMNSLTVFYTVRMALTVAASVYLLTHTDLGVFTIVVINLPAALFTVLFMMRVLKKYIGAGVCDQLKFTYARGVITAAILCPAAYCLKNYLTPDMDVIFKLAYNLAIMCPLSALVLWRIGFSAHDKERILRMGILKKFDGILSALSQ